MQNDNASASRNFRNKKFSHEKKIQIVSLNNLFCLENLRGFSCVKIENMFLSYSKFFHFFFDFPLQHI